MNPRRSFLSRLGAAAAALSFGSSTASAEPRRAKAFAERADAERWQPARDAKDDWFDQIPGRHRLFFDTLTDGGLREARGFANNYFDGSKSAYGLEAADLAVIICLRHSATPFAFTDPFWAKYGPLLAESLTLADPKLDRLHGIGRSSVAVASQSRSPLACYKSLMPPCPECSRLSPGDVVLKELLG